MGGLNFRNTRTVLRKIRVGEELKDMVEKSKKAREENQEVEAVVTANDAIIICSVIMLGKGKKKGGGAQFQKARFGVLGRVRLVGELSPNQRNDWEYSKTSWDGEMTEGFGEDWTEVCSEITQNVLEELMAGKRNALSDFMRRETQRVLARILALVVPGAP